jgi:hypothetical protein
MAERAKGGLLLPSSSMAQTASINFAATVLLLGNGFYRLRGECSRQGSDERPCQGMDWGRVGSSQVGDLDRSRGASLRFLC